jgi:hypothetical protein
MNNIDVLKKIENYLELGYNVPVLVAGGGSGWIDSVKDLDVTDYAVGRIDEDDDLYVGRFKAHFGNEYDIIVLRHNPGYNQERNDMYLGF